MKFCSGLEKLALIFISYSCNRIELFTIMAWLQKILQYNIYFRTVTITVQVPSPAWCRNRFRESFWWNCVVTIFGVNGGI